MTKAVTARLQEKLQDLQDPDGPARAFRLVMAASALVEAEASDRRHAAGETLGPLDGKLVSVKDILDVRGEQSLAGSGQRGETPRAAADAPVVARLRAAGAVVIGKTVLDEYCFTCDGINSHFGTPGNARDPLRIPGGSSSGAGVAVGLGVCDIAIGSDTGGSIRIPAALNGVAGFKPTARRVPLEGCFPLAPQLDSLGPLARSVAELAATDAVLAADDPAPLLSVPLAAMRLALPPARLTEGMEPAVARAFHAACTRLREAGATFIDCPIDDLLARMLEVTADASFAAIEAARIHAHWLGDEGAVAQSRIAKWLARRLDYPAAHYGWMQDQRAELIAQMDARLQNVDAVLMPTVPITAPLIRDLEQDEDFAAAVEWLLLRNCQIANQFDLTAVSLPLPVARLPVGLMLMARGGTDRNLLAVAQGVESPLAA